MLLKFKPTICKVLFCHVTEISTPFIKSMPKDFAEFAMDVHGLDVNAPPPPMPKLVLDTKA